MLLIALLLASYVPFCAARIVQGNNPALSTSFTFAIGPHAYDHESNVFYIGANVAVPGNTFAVALSENGQTFVPLATVAGTDSLTGKRISFMANLSQILLPAVVPGDLPNRIFVPSPTSVASVPPLNDATGAATAAGIRALSAGITNNIAQGHYIIAAVTNNAAGFGVAGAGIAAVLEAGAVPTMTTLDVTTGTVGGNRAFPLDTTTPAVFISIPVASIDPTIVDIHYDVNLGRFYIGLAVAGDMGGGARAVVAGRIVNNKIQLDPIAPDSAFAGTVNKIVGVGTGITVTAYKVRTLHTSSRLPYLIVAGGNGDPDTVGNTVYAMPLTNDGVLADVNGVPTDRFRPLYPQTYLLRGLPAAAQTPDALWSSTNTAAIVGGGPLPIPPTAKITDMIAYCPGNGSPNQGADAVYVTIDQAYDGTTTPPTAPGVFYSQAIFDSFGRIMGWTAWARAAGTDAQMSGLGVNPKRDTFWLMPFKSTGNDTVQLTDWGTNQDDGLLGGLTQQVQQILPTSQGGVHNIFSFAQTTSGFGNLPGTVNNQISVLAILGRNTVMLVQSGSNPVANEFKPTFGSFATGQQFFTDGTLNGFVAGAQMLVISGGALATLGPLTSVEVSRAPLTGGNNGFFFFGGVGGVGVLSNPNGTGWNTAAGQGLKAGFVNLTSTMLVRTLGNYQFVRKLVCDGTYLYVLTNTTLDRITLASIAAGGTLTTVNLATPTALGLQSFASFSDMQVSGNLALLATSQGLFKSNPNSVNSWTQVPVPESAGPVTRLQFITPTNIDADFSQGSLMYVLSGNVAFNQARIARFAIGADGSVRPLNDLFIKGVPSYLIESGSYRNFITADSVSLFNLKTSDGFVGGQLLSYPMYSMADVYLGKNNVLVSQLPATTSGTIRKPVRNDASGAWLLTGDFGMYTNE